MVSDTTFTVNPATSLHQPLCAGLDVLVKGLQTSQSIQAQQSPDAPITLLKETPQSLYVQTAGSSGNPKTVQRTPGSWTASFELTRSRFGISSSDTYATLGILSHSLSLYATLEALHIGADLCSLSEMRPTQQSSALIKHSVSILYATPTQLRYLLTASDPVFPRLRFIFCGGGKLNHDLSLALKSACPNVKLIEFFGASETSFISMSDALTPVGSVGRPYPNVAIEITDQDSDGVGEIWVKSPYLFTGYADAQMHDCIWKDDYLSIGELCQLDAEGYLYLKGRKSRMITISDQNVYPENVETVINSFKHVENCAVVATNDDMRGARLVCFYSGNEVSMEELRQHCRKLLKPSFVPKQFNHYDELPVLPSGKTDLQRLQEIADGMS